MRVANTKYLFQVAGHRSQVIDVRPATCDLRPVAVLLLLQWFIGCLAVYGADLSTVVAGLQRRYASVETVTGSFQQSYRAPGINQVESGVFWLKKPGFMRWEYRSPEEKLFVADGRESFSYDPKDRQVTVQPLTPSDLHSTPLEFLLGAGDINKSFAVSWETEFQPQADRTYLIRLTPNKREAQYEFLVLELDQETYDIRRIMIRESSGNTSEFLLTNVMANIKIENKKFQFKTPKGVEEIRLNNE